MIRMIGRETIIALRARHAAFRVAMAILHPRPPSTAPKPSPPPPPPPSGDAVPAIDVLAEFTAWESQEREARRRRAARRLAALLWTAAIVVGAWNWPRKTSPLVPLRPAPPSFNR
jgi:hypothetical protein